MPFVAAVSLTEDGASVAYETDLVPGLTFTAIAQWANDHRATCSKIFSDGLGCFSAVTAVGCTHQATLVAGRKPNDMPEFKWINTVLGNLKTSLSGYGHSLA